MKHELCIESVTPGTVSEVMDHTWSTAQQSPAVRQLEGFWSSEFGVLNQAVYLWNGPFEGPRPQAISGVRSREVTLLQPEMPLRKPPSAGNIYELRTYRLRPGTVPQWLRLLHEALPVREKYSRPVGLWSVLSGTPDQVKMLWVYPDLNARMRARAEAAREPVWMEFTKRCLELFLDMHSVILLPGKNSPLA